MCICCLWAPKMRLLREKVWKSCQNYDFCVKKCEKVVKMTTFAWKSVKKLPKWWLLREKVWKSCQNDDFCMKKSPKWRLLLIFIEALKMAENPEKNRFYVFCLFTPLYRRFRLSRVSQTIDLDEIYRLVSKILNFMPCGSVFDRFCVHLENIIESLENLLRIYRKSIENL